MERETLRAYWTELQCRKRALSKITEAEIKYCNTLEEFEWCLQLCGAAFPEEFVYSEYCPEQDRQYCGEMYQLYEII